MNSVRRRAWDGIGGGASVAVLVWALSQGAALAQSAEQAPAKDSKAAAAAEGSEVLVTARHRKESVQSVPLAISAVGGRELNGQHLDRVADYATKLPNFAALQQNPRVSQSTIRGVGGNANNDGAESGVGLIVDNVFLTHIGFSWNDFSDLEGIEVVRGPQGTLLGKNTTVGAIIVKTRQPSFDAAFGFDATYGNDNRTQFHLFATGPVIADKLAYRLTVSDDQGGGWITNAFDGVKYLDNNRYSVRAQLLFTPTVNVTDRPIVEHEQSREYNNFYPPVGDANYNYNPDGSILSPRTGSWTNKLINLLGYTPSYNYPNNANYDTQARVVSAVDGVSNEANWKAAGLNLTAITAWRKFAFTPANDGDGTPFPIDRSGYTVRVSQYSQELRLANQTGGPLDWQVGAYGLREDLSSDYLFDFYSDATTYFLSPALPSNVLNGVEYSKLGLTHTTSGALFGQSTWHVTDKASLTAGLRYTTEDKQVSVSGTTTGGASLIPAYVPYRAATLAAIGGTPAAQGGLFYISDSKTTDSVSWLINPAYKLTEDVLLYASASYGEKSGAANTTASPVTATYTLPLIIAPEKSLDFEAGVKLSWFSHRLVVNLNLFDDELSNYQASEINPAQSLTPYLANVGKVRTAGVEFESGLSVTRDLSLNLSAGYDDAKYLSYASAPTPIELVAAVGPTLSLSGQQVIGAPKVNAQAGYDFHHEIEGDLEFYTYGNATYRGRVSLYNPLSPFGWQDAYTIFNVGVGVRKSRYSLLLWSKNLTDKRYLIGFGTATSASPFVGVLGDHRTEGLTFSAKF